MYSCRTISFTLFSGYIVATKSVLTTHKVVSTDNHQLSSALLYILENGNIKTYQFSSTTVVVFLLPLEHRYTLLLYSRRYLIECSEHYNLQISKYKIGNSSTIIT